MTATTSPDGQQTTSETTEQRAEGGSGESWRDAAEVKRIIAKRDEYKTENADLRKRLDALETESQAAKRAKDEADGNIRGLVDSLTKENETLKAGLAERDTKLTERDRRDRRRDFTDVILERAHPQHREELRHMLVGLHEDGELDMYAEDTKPAANKAAEKLAKRFPDKFRSATETARTGGTASGPRTTIPDDVPYMELPDEIRRSMSDEDFAKRYGQQGLGKHKGMAI